MSKSIISVRTTALVLAFAVLLSAMCPTAFAVQTPVQAFGEPGQPCEHNYETVLTAPTCTRIGCTIYMCPKCGDKYTGDEVPALGHDFNDGKCTRCGAIEDMPTVIDVALQNKMETMTDEARIVVAVDLKEIDRDIVFAEIVQASGLDVETIGKVLEYRGTTEESMAYINAKRAVLRRLYDKYNREFLAAVLPDLPVDCLYYVADTHATIWASLTKAEILLLACEDKVFDLGYVADSREDMIVHNTGTGEDATTKIQLREDYFEKLKNETTEFPEDATVNDVIIASELGRFHGVWVVMMRFNYGATSPCATYFRDEVDGIQFQYLKEMGDQTQWGVVYSDRQFYSLQEAYTQGVLTREDLLALQKSTYEPIPFKDVMNAEAYYYEPVYWAVMNGITKGTSDTLFSPDKACTRAEVVTFLWRAAGSPEPTSEVNPFADVSADRYYSKAVLWAVENGITEGTGEGKFSPDTVCTRAQIVTFLWRSVGKPEPEEAENPFTDVEEGRYYEKAVLWALENDVTKGVNATSFVPEKTCTRAEVVTFLSRAAGE